MLLIEINLIGLATLSSKAGRSILGHLNFRLYLFIDLLHVFELIGEIDKLEFEFV